MTSYDWIFLLLALLAGGAVIVYILIPAQPLLAPEKPRLSIDISARVEINQSITITLTGTQLSGKIIQFHDGEKMESYSCNANPCSFFVTRTYSTPGSRTFDARAEKNLRATRTIQVSSSQRVCLDGTLEGACALIQPMRCTNAALVSDCNACGCPVGQTCQNQQCQNPPLAFAFSRFEGPGQTYATVLTPLTIGITSLVSFPVSGTFLLFIDEYNTAHSKTNETPHAISLTNVGGGNEYRFTVEQPLHADTREVGGRWYPHGGVYDASTLLAATQTTIPMVVGEDAIPPAAPANLIFSIATENQFILSWDASPSSDVAQYRVYQQITSAGGFTAYHAFAQTTQTQFTVSALPETTAYVIRALDGAGNESPASNPIVVPAS